MQYFVFNVFNNSYLLDRIIGRYGVIYLNEISLCKGGGLSGQYDVHEGEGVMENWTNLDKGREGVKNPGNFADVICTLPLT